MWLRWTACLILGVPAALLILLNWAGLVAASREGRGYSFAPAFLCGIVGAVACRLCPVETVRALWWVPLLLDPFLLVMVIVVPLHVIARLTGRRSPFDPPEEGGTS